MTGGQSPSIGVIGLDTSFTKIPGHIRNPATFDFPVICQVVPGAIPQNVVTCPEPALLTPFIHAAQALEAAGAGAITSACGFLALHQRELAAAVRVPVYSSSLLLLPLVHAMLGPGRLVGVLTANEDSLGPAYFAAVGAGAVPVRVAGMQEQPEFREVILEGRRDDLDIERLGHEASGLAARLVRDHPDVGALVLECTDLVPFAQAIQERTSRPVFDIVTLTGLVHAGLRRHTFPPGQVGTARTGRLA
jgi:hypothetical protein